MSVYTSFYEDVYGGEFPLDLRTALLLGGTWTDITGWTYNRSAPAAFTITRGRPDETSQVSPSQLTAQLNNRDGRFTSRNPTGPYYGQLGRNTPVRVSVPDSATSMRIEDDTVSYADTLGPVITGDIDVRLEMDLSGWAPAALISQWSDWALVLNGDGTLGWWISQSGVTHIAGSAQPVPLGHVAVRATRAHTSGIVTFYTAPTITGTWTQLGAAVTSVTGALSGATEDLIVGYSPGVTAQNPAYGGPSGRFFDAQVYSGIGGTLEAEPAFSAQADDAATWTDAQGNDWGVNGTASIDSRSYRYHGEMSSLPVAWDPSGRDIWVPFTAGGILRRLQQGSAQVISAMRRSVTALAAAWGTAAYWPCEDGENASQIAAGLPGGIPMSLNGAPGFQGQAGSLSADQVFACSASLPTVGTSMWTGRVPAYTPVADATMFLLQVPPGTPDATLVTISNAGGGWLNLNYAAASGGSLNIGGDASVTGPTGINGQALWVQVTQAGVLNIVPLSGAPSFWAGTGAATGRVTSVIVNPGSANLGSVELGQIVVAAGPPGFFDDAPVPLLQAYAGETAGNRFSRLCTENGVPGRVYGYPDVSAVMGPQQIDTLVNVLQSCEDADCGAMYEPAEAHAVGYRTLASLCNQAPALTLDYSQAQVGDQETSPVSLISVDDDQYTRNDITVTRSSGTTSGSSYESQLGDGSPMSVSGVGDYVSSKSVNVQSDAQLPGVAGWLVHVGTVAGERYPQVVTGLHRPPIVATGLGYQIQDVRIGGYVEIVNPPAWLPPGTIKQLVAGVTETLTSFLYQVSWNTIPESPYEVAAAGTARADTAGSQLASGVSSTAATLSVETTAGNLWTTDSGVGGQQAIVPLYSYPPSGFWSDVTAAAPQMGMIICNVDNGPGTGYESNFGAVFAAAAAAGIMCLGYVPTGYGADSLASVEAQIDLWDTYYGITSIMFDTVSTSATYLSHYESLVAYVHGRGGTAILNPGAIPAEGYMSIGADVVQVCEDSYANFAADAAAAPAWLFDYPATAIGVTCNECSTEGDMVTAVGLSQSAFNAHWVWVTADGIYAAEPSYFADEVAGLAGEPGSGDFPFDILIGGEQITVTGITGSSSPQSFAVARSVNGVVKAQDTGAAVALYDTPVAALAGAI